MYWLLINISACFVAVRQVMNIACQMRASLLDQAHYLTWSDTLTKEPPSSTWKGSSHTHVSWQMSKFQMLAKKQLWKHVWRYLQTQTGPYPQDARISTAPEVFKASSAQVSLRCGRKSCVFPELIRQTQRSVGWNQSHSAFFALVYPHKTSTRWVAILHWNIQWNLCPRNSPTVFSDALNNSIRCSVLVVTFLRKSSREFEGGHCGHLFSIFHHTCSSIGSVIWASKITLTQEPMMSWGLHGQL